MRARAGLVTALVLAAACAAPEPSVSDDGAEAGAPVADASGTATGAEAAANGSDGGSAPTDGAAAARDSDAPDAGARPPDAAPISAADAAAVDATSDVVSPPLPSGDLDLKACEPIPSGMQLAFPGAEGFGRYARGGRGGSVCHVTTLDDSGPGSLRDCVSQGERTVVFDVAGWITLSKDLGITASNLTIAGQSAPGGGIGIRGMKLSLGGSHIVLRFVRVRRGTVTTTARNDAMAISSKASNVIVDHCSVGFGTDENLSMPGDEGVGPRELTLQWSVVAWGLQRNNHSAGSLLTASNTTLHHNVYAFNGTRNPKARSEEGRLLDFVNNVIYGWNAPDPVGEAAGWSISKQAFLLADTANGMHYANAVANYFISHGQRTAAQAFGSGATNAEGKPTFNLYFDGNLLDGNANGKLDVSSSDWSMVGTATRLDQRRPAPLVCTQAAPEAFEQVMRHVGASAPVRDEVDALLVQQIRAQNGIKIQDEADLKVGDKGYGALASGSARPDTDRDGMPDAWEIERGLDPRVADDRNGDDDRDGYTNLEEYLNQLAASAFPR